MNKDLKIAKKTIKTEIQGLKKLLKSFNNSSQFSKAVNIIAKAKGKVVVIGTGKTHTVLEFVKIVFKELKLNFREYLVIDSFFYRHDETGILVANSENARKKLAWNPKVTFEELAIMMVKNDYDNLRKKI